MSTVRRRARTAGLLYLLMIITGLPGLIFIPSKLIVTGNAAATADHIRAGATLLRIGIASDLIGEVLYIYLALALYRLLETVNRSVAVQMVALVLISVPIVLLNALNEVAALAFAQSPPYLTTFTRAQLDSLVYLVMYLREQGIHIAQVLWALWLVPFGWLVIRSQFLPKPLGVLLMFGAAGQLTNVVTNLFPGNYTAIADPIGQVLALGEMPIIPWLVIWGMRRATGAELAQAAVT